jgi:hypothetical protein
MEKRSRSFEISILLGGKTPLLKACEASPPSPLGHPILSDPEVYDLRLRRSIRLLCNNEPLSDPDNEPLTRTAKPRD